jgi:hypothetical protein
MSSYHWCLQDYYFLLVSILRFSMQTTEDASLVSEQHCFKCIVISFHYDYASLPPERDRINKGNYCQPERGTSSRISGDLSLSRLPAAFIFVCRREVSVNCSDIRNMRYLSLQKNLPSIMCWCRILASWNYN